MKLNSEQNKIHERALRLATESRLIEKELLEMLGQVYEQKIFLALGFGSLYEYANRCLGLSEANSYTYGAIVKKSKNIPELNEKIQEGLLTITNARRILPVLTPENQEDLLQKATQLSKRELEREVATIHPEPVRESVRAVDEDRHALKLGISSELLKKLKRAQALLSNQKRKNASLEEVLEASVELFLQRTDPIEKAKRSQKNRTYAAESTLVPGQNEMPRDRMQGKKFPDTKGVSGIFSASERQQTKIAGGVVHVPKQRRPLPASIQHKIFQRDQGQCQFRNHSTGEICGSSYFIELHHKIPVSRNGRNTLENLVTLCSAHHAYHHDVSTI